MTRTDVVNGGLLLAAIALAILGAMWASAPPPPSPLPPPGGGSAAAQRIASLDIVADAVLAELGAGPRVVAACAWTEGRWRDAFPGRPRLKALKDLEQVLALKPDLAVVTTYGAEAERIARLREAGVRVLDLGSAHGLQDARHSIALIGEAVGSAPAAAALLARVDAEVAALRAAAPATRARAVCLEAVGDQLYGGTVGSSYHDLLDLAGLADALADRYRGWPVLDAEALLAVDPDLLVVPAGQAAALRRRPALARLRCLNAPGGLVELEPGLYRDPGLGLLDAARALRAAVSARP